MHIDEYREHCINKTGVTEEFPFDENILVFKIMGKMFSATDVENFESINVKCDPELAVELREQYYKKLELYEKFGPVIDRWMKYSN